MTVDVAGILYGTDSPLYSTLGTSAALVNVDGESFALTVIDMTSGIEISPGGDIAIATIRPACAVRAVELAQRGIAVSGLRNAQVTFNGKTWTVERKLNNPSPSGESTGEFILILTEAEG